MVQRDFDLNRGLSKSLYELTLVQMTKENEPTAKVKMNLAHTTIMFAAILQA